MKSLLLIASLTIPLVVGAANVVWDCLQIDYVGYGYHFFVKCNGSADFAVTESKNADGVTFTAGDAIVWEHSDFKNAAFFFNYLLYRKIINEESE